MLFTNFSVSNYRSITTAHRIQMSNMTVLVGRNNEGKSNILRALSLAMDVMKYYAEYPRMLTIPIRFLKNYYVWERDYPILLQEKRPNGCSLIDLSFELSEEEIQEIRKSTGIRLNYSLPVRISINKDGAKIDIPKRGTPAFADSQNKQRVIESVCNKIDFNFIPAIRTDNDAIRVIGFLIEKELSSLESTKEYTEATAIIDRLQQKVLDDIAYQITTPLQTFLPSVKGIQINTQKEQRRAALRRNFEVIIDDGTPTPIQLKGDGIKSLTALAMLNIINQSNKVSVIAIEEPESHLHPESARQLNSTIATLSEKHQVILTTHSPLFVNRLNLKQNIIVKNGKATPVKRVKEIRDVLGIHVSDNLFNAENILIVEGEDDKISLDKLLPIASEKIKKAINSGLLIIDDIGGAGNLSHKLTFYRGIQCRYHILLDNDDAGRRAGQDAESKGLATAKEITYTICNGSSNSELEDCYNKEAYMHAIEKEFGVNLSCSQFKGDQKWSIRVAQCFKSQGKLWNDATEKKLKCLVADSIPASLDEALNSYKRTSIDALVTALEKMLID